jgi:enamine deaminase RidA (YjgF/YER057c/UK114 family)
MRTRIPMATVTRMHPEERLRELGLTLPDPPKPAAVYVPAVRVGDLVFTAGQGPFGTNFTGKVGADVSIEQAQEAARVTCLNGLAVIKAEIGDLANVKRFVKLTVFVASAPGFTEQPRVANGASELLEQVFGENGKHARSAVGVAELPFDIPVEIEFIAEVG